MGSTAILAVGIGIIFIAFFGLVLTVGSYVLKKQRVEMNDENGNVVSRKPAYVLDNFPM